MGNDFKLMIRGYFGEQIIVKRRAPGSYVDGVWNEGSESDVSLWASVQPATGAQVAFLPENQRTSEVMVAFTDVEIYTSRASSDQNTDIIVWRGTRYKVISVKRWLPTQEYWESMIVREVEQ